MMMSVKTTNGVKVMLCEGALDTQTSLDARDHLGQLIEEGARKILVNFDTLEYISSAGLHVLLTVAKQLKSVDGELRVCCLNDVVKEVFDISGFVTIFKVFGSESEALNGF